MTPNIRERVVLRQPGFDEVGAKLAQGTIGIPFVIYFPHSLDASLRQKETCEDGKCLPVRLLKEKEGFKDKIAVIVEDYRTSPSTAKRNRSVRNNGIVKA
ncbi:hypothetical protein AeNC1_015803, partial [Aphanomyces euteiches]